MSQSAKSLVIRPSDGGTVAPRSRSAVNKLGMGLVDPAKPDRKSDRQRERINSPSIDTREDIQSTSISLELSQVARVCVQ